MTTTNKFYHALLHLQRTYPELTFNNDGYEYQSRATRDRNAEAILAVEGILRQTLDGFEEFNNFKIRESGEIVVRVQYDYNADTNNPHFTGVGYFPLTDFKEYPTNEIMTNNKPYTPMAHITQEQANRAAEFIIKEMELGRELETLVIATYRTTGTAGWAKVYDIDFYYLDPIVNRLVAFLKGGSLRWGEDSPEGTGELLFNPATGEFSLVGEEQAMVTSTVIYFTPGQEPTTLGE